MAWVSFLYTRSAKTALFDLLLQIFKQGGGKKIENGDLQSVADLFDRGNGGRIVSTADDIVQRRLRNTANGGKLI